MTKQVQRRRGTATQHTSFTGAEGELSVNTTNKSVHVHDNVTAGGFEAARVDMDNVTSSSILTAAGITATTTELNYVDGVTSAIQTQIDGKAGTASPTFTGTLTTANLTATGTTTLAGASTSADITFGDNDKAVFGAGSDLQIYHDGSHSYISDQGTGQLRLLASQFQVMNAAGTESMVFGAQDNTATLYYDNAAKLATTSTGVDVTGTLTSDGLTVDGDVAVNSNNLDIIGTNPKLNLMESDTTDINAQIITTSGSMLIRTLTDSKTTAKTRMKIDHTTGDISFYEDTGTTAKFFWDASAERLGIGISTPSAKLEVKAADLGGTAGDSEESLRLTTSNTNVDKLVFTNERLSTGTTWTSAAQRIQRVVDASKMGYIQFGHPTSDLITFGENTTERMRIDGEGNVGIGTKSPAVRLSGTVLTIDDTSTSGLELTNSESQAGEMFSDASNTYISERRAGSLIFRTAGSNERMRIDSSGNLLVGKTSTGSTVAGILLGNNDKITATRSSGASAAFVRTSSDGSIVNFQKDGSTVGSIESYAGVVTGMTLYPAGNVGIRGATSEIVPYANGSDRDNSVDLGRSSARFQDLYLSGGVYLGGTGSANYLDDYEIGDYVATPGLQSGSVTLYSGQDRFSYTKIGRMVRVGGRIRVSAVSSPSGFINIPLPFVAGDLTDESEYSLISIATFGVGLPTGTISVFGETAPSSSNAILIGMIDNAGWSTVDASNISVGDYITISGSYLTA